MTKEPDEAWRLTYVEVSRTAHELSQRHGWNAHVYAAKAADEALADGDAEAHAFWQRVAASLHPRISS